VPDSNLRVSGRNRVMKCYADVKICAAANACLFFRQSRLPIVWAIHLQKIAATNSPSVPVRSWSVRTFRCTNGSNMRMARCCRSTATPLRATAPFSNQHVHHHVSLAHLSRYTAEFDCRTLATSGRERASIILKGGEGAVRPIGGLAGSPPDTFKSPAQSASGVSTGFVPDPFTGNDA